MLHPLNSYFCICLSLYAPCLCPLPVQAQDSGLGSSVCTLYELHSGEDTTDQGGYMYVGIQLRLLCGHMTKVDILGIEVQLMYPLKQWPIVPRMSICGSSPGNRIIL